MVDPRRLLTRSVPSQNACWWALLLIISLAGALLRLYRIDAASLSLDEIGEVLVAGHRLIEPLLSGVRAQAGAAPLDYLGIKFTTIIFGATPEAVRLWPWLMGSLGVPAIAWTAWEIFRSRWTAMAAAALLAVAAFDVYYAREVRFYALSLLLSLVILALFAGATRRRSTVWWGAFGIAIAAGLYAHYFTAFVALTCAGGFALSGVIDLATVKDCRAAAPRWLGPALGLVLANAVALLAFLPWYFYAVAPQLRQVASGELPALSLIEVDRIVSTVLFPPGTLDPAPWGGLFVRGLELLALAGLAVAWSRHRSAALALGFLTVGILPAVRAADSGGAYFFHVRQVIVLVGSLNLLAAGGFVWLVRWLAESRGRLKVLVRPAAALACAFAIIISSSSLGQVYSGSFEAKEDLRGAASLLAREVCADARIYVNIPRPYAYGVGYYAPRLEDQAQLVNVPTDRTLPEVMREIDLRPRDWVVTLVYAPRTGGREGIEQLVRDLTQRGYELRKFTYLLLLFVPAETCPRPGTSGRP
jgi:4-amino-4-deoxy-L-arabinose transferase-like glycosyltransferase